MIEKILNNETYKQKIVPIALFLVVELMFLLAFNLGDLGIAYRLIAFVLALILLPTFLKTLNDDIARGFIFVFLPLVIYLLSVTFSPVFSIQEGLIPSQSVTLLNRGFFQLLATFVGAISFLFLGYFVSRTNLLSKYNFIFLIFGGIATLLLISMLATLVNYGFFHRIVYAGQVNYYEASPYPIATQANLLMGFSIATVHHHILVTMGLVVASPAFALIFYRDFIDRKYIYFLITFAIIGLLSVVLLTSFIHLVFLLPALLIALMIKFNVHKMKYFKTAVLSILGFIVLLVFIGVLASFEVEFIVNIIKSNPISNRLFYNGYTARYMGIIKESLDFNYIFGNPFNLTEVEPVFTTFPSGNILLDMVRETGLIGGIAFLAFLVVAIKIAIDYINSDKDGAIVKYMILAFLVTLFARYMFYYPFNQLSYVDSYWSVNYFPFVESKEFAISLFLIGYMYIAKTASKPKLEEVKNHE